ncbi:MAG TPA: hypothetical protein VFP84_01460 [Kofleriaceae bacterium]|nr:hypothetical protein [Kofleriaceae bacterium]
MRAYLRAAALALAACATGCFDDKGLGIEVDVGDTTGLASVELFVALQQTCANGDIQAPTMKAFDGALCMRDTPQRLTAPIKDGTATFRLEAAVQDLPLQLVVAVGLKTDGTPSDASSILFGLTVPRTGSQLVRTTLSTGGDRAFEWISPTNASCVMATYTDPNNTIMRSFILPKDDLDCDGLLPPRDCAPTLFDPKTAVPAEPNCLPADPGSACMIGSTRQCTDGKGPSETGICKPIQDPFPTCLPHTYCEICHGPLDVGCFVSKLDPPRIQCTIPTTDGHTMCDDNERGTGDVGGFSITDCEDLELGDLQTGSGFVAKDTFAGASLNLSAGDGGNKCLFRIDWQSGDFTGSGPVHGFVRVRTQTSALLVPIQFEFQPLGSGNCEITCELAGVPTDAGFAGCTAATATP